MLISKPLSPPAVRRRFTWRTVTWRAVACRTVACRTVAWAGVALGIASGAGGCGGGAFSADDNGALADSGPDGTAPADTGAPPSMDATTPIDGATHVDSGAPPGDAGPIPCPSASPTAQTACGPDGRECEYGTSPVTVCNTVATCTGGAWSITMANSSGKTCPTHNDSSCPVLEENAKGICTQSGAICDYARGRCECASGGGVVITPIDGSVTTTWRCATPSPSNCPEPRQNLGTLCTAEGLECDYGSCVISGGSAQICRGGVWQSASVPCPQ